MHRKTYETQNSLLIKCLKTFTFDRNNLKYFWENWFQNCFFIITGSKTESIPINRFKNGTDSNKPVYETEPVYETGLPT